ncbi:MaoC/PaaZ C-terminal domain-containing protein [Thalassovita taeanensis]|uniref:Acyl dehydratase n=1 Tax=Thalassovita taeanensis TaxID=657014 RepID=A0A1H9BWV8_9RHOB|nr:MaoC/PaaZ C-terminal domain-containing protein [Thalassovita taeanensis]SEP93369.1 Acyl dehydratase [Thalassovita taeanensis]
MDLSVIKGLKFEPINHCYTFKDTILYALGLGYGSNPVDPAELEFVYEENLKAVPSLCVVLAHPGFWAKDPKYGIDWVKILHAEQDFEIHKPLPKEGTVRGEYEIEAVVDKGADKAAMLYQLKKLYDAEDDLVATVRSVLFMRGDGGCGSFGAAPAMPGAIEATTPDQVVEIATLPQQALIYRLSGDFNPIHADPAPAKKAGFDRPILHGLCSMGIATRALLQTYAPGNPDKLKSMFVRFSKPVFPGETIVTEFFQNGNEVRFRCRSKERDIVVLDRGHAVFHA